MDIEKFKQEASKLSADPYSRVADHIKPLIERDDVLINCHCHIFNQETVPKALFNMKMPWQTRKIVRLVKFLHRIRRRTSDDWASRQAYFIDLFIKSTREIADKLISYYPANTVFTPLMMDMHLRAGKDKIKSAEWFIIQQANDIKDLLEKKYNFLPFLPIDPTFEDNGLDLYDVFIKGFTGLYGFIPFGIKIYPTMGYLPRHPKLREIFKVCEAKNIPVTVHCSRGVIHGYKNRLKNIPYWDYDSNGEVMVKYDSERFCSGTSYANYFNHPKNWELILETFPDLRLNFGHFGGEKQWEKLLKGKNNTWCSRIMDYITRFKNVYADISFTNAYPGLFDLLRSRIERSKVVRERTLYGLDYYMVVVRGHYRSLKADFDTAMGDEIINQIGIKNPRNFLGFQTSS